MIEPRSNLQLTNCVDYDDCDDDDGGDENQLEWQISPKKSIILCTSLQVVIWIFLTNQDRYFKWFKCY